ncbi:MULTISPECIES: hypothetical protein [unclassified Herbaspirillum]|uniref:hypothetical protein n=1 Tax=unclassified Herbaspirillum TaxID=2624150 RepID=UPI003839FDCE
MTASPWIATSIPGSAKCSMVSNALPGYLPVSLNAATRISEARGPLRVKKMASKRNDENAHALRPEIQRIGQLRGATLSLRHSASFAAALPTISASA